jgi:tetratricopeptide (TPR) repeat protein
VFSLFSKEIAIVVPLLMFSYAFVYYSHIEKNKIFIGSLSISFPYFFIFAVYLFIRISLFNQATLLSIQERLVPYFFTAVKGLYIYLQLIVFPVGQTVDHHLPILENIWEAKAIVGFTGFIGLILVSVFILFPRSKCLFFGVIWFLIAMLPNLILPTNEPVSEHTMYFPSIGCFLIVGLVVSELWNRHISGLKNLIKIPSIGLFVLIIIQLGILTLNRNIVWNNSLQLWTDAVAKAPMKSRPHLNLGLAYVKAGKKDDAQREFYTAISIDPDNYDAYNNLGVLFFGNGDYEAAQEAFEKSLRINGVNPDALNNIGGVYVKKGEFDKAISVLEKVLQIRPQDFMAYSNLGRIYIQKGNLEMACECLDKSIRLGPDYQASNSMYRKYCVKQEKDAD